MPEPYKSLYTETLSEKRQVRVGIPTGSKRFGMGPEDVLSRTDITPSAKVVLITMHMESIQTGRVALSDQVLGRKSGVSRSHAIDCRKQLEAAGLIAKDGPPIKQVQPYRLIHHRLVGKTGQDEAAGEREVITARPHREMVQCLSCRRKVGGVGKHGWCRTCAADKDLPRRVLAARGRLGPNATADQIATHLKLAKFSAKIQGILLTMQEKATA